MLIEKEWLSFGHKFTERCGLIAGIDPKEISPIFTQFIDCVWQLTQQFPMSFQFNERYLLTIHDHVFSCQFGTFIGCCEKDRIDLRFCRIVFIDHHGHFRNAGWSNTSAVYFFWPFSILYSLTAGIIKEFWILTFILISNALIYRKIEMTFLPLIILLKADN